MTGGSTATVHYVLFHAVLPPLLFLACVRSNWPNTFPECHCRWASRFIFRKLGYTF